MDHAEMYDEILELNAYIQDVELKNKQMVQHAQSQQVLIEQLQNCIFNETEKIRKKKVGVDYLKYKT